METSPNQLTRGNIIKYYITFLRNQQHIVHGMIFDKNNAALIEAKDIYIATSIAMIYFGKWDKIATEDVFNKLLRIRHMNIKVLKQPKRTKSNESNTLNYILKGFITIIIVLFATSLLIGLFK